MHAHCKLQRGQSERDLEGFARQMDEIEIPQETKAECSCSSGQHMEAIMVAYSKECQSQERCLAHPNNWQMRSNIQSEEQPSEQT